MRFYLSGPHIGPLHTVLASSRPRRRGATPWRGWLWFFFLSVFGVACAWALFPPLGILALIGVLIAAGLAIYGTVAAHREMRARAEQAQPRSASYTDRNGRTPTRRRRRSEMRARAASRP